MSEWINRMEIYCQTKYPIIIDDITIFNVSNHEEAKKLMEITTLENEETKYKIKQLIHNSFRRNSLAIANTGFETVILKLSILQNGRIKIYRDANDEIHLCNTV